MLSFEDLRAHLHSALEMVRLQSDPIENRVLLSAWFWLKCVNDEFEERFRTLVQEEIAVGRSEAEARVLADDADEYRFFLPAESQWPNLAGAEGRFAERFGEACAALERRYPNILSGIFRPTRPSYFTGISAAQRANLSRDLWEHFNQIDLSRRHLFSPEIIGDAHTQVLDEIAAGNRKKADFASPPHLMRLLAELLQPEPGMRICDPTCGAGGSLIACAHYLMQRGHHPQNLSLFGQELNPANWALCKLNLLLHDLPDHEIWQGHALTKPLLNARKELLQFDLILAHLPFSVANWGYSEALPDPWQRFEAGMPPEKRGDLAFVLHVLATLNERGRAALVVPQGVLFRSGVEGQIRRELLQKEVDAIEAVISLPPGWLYDSKLPAAALVLNRAKPASRQGRVLFINAGALPDYFPRENRHESAVLALAALFHSGGEPEKLGDYVSEEIARRRAAIISRRLRLQEIWREETQGQALAEKEARTHTLQLDNIQTALQKWLSQPSAQARCFSSADQNEIARNRHYYLTPSHYCVEKRAVHSFDLAQERQALETLEAERNQAETEMDRLLLELAVVQ